jgi:hypothetical protein
MEIGRGNAGVAPGLSGMECPAFALTSPHALWTGRSCDGMVRPSALLLAYFGAAFDVLGV